MSTSPVTAMLSAPARADGSGPDVASFYDRHMALVDGVAYGWAGQGVPRRWRAGVVQVGVSQDAYFALLDDGTLVSVPDLAGRTVAHRQDVARFAAGQSGWFAIDRDRVLWRSGAAGTAPRRVSDNVVAASIGDGTDYFIAANGALHVQGLAHRGQYGDGRLATTPDFVVTAHDVVAVRAHTGHALHLRRDGAVMGTGGNRFGPLSAHGLGDKADRWGLLFSGAAAIATGSRHSAAIRTDGSLWVWGQGFAIEPRQLLDGVQAVAAGDTATIARTRDGAWWQWDEDQPRRRLALP